jgi:hypothetical protein
MVGTFVCLFKKTTMKKHLLLAYMAVAALSPAFSQAPAFAWAKASASLPNPDVSTTGGIVVDTINNVVYGTGSFSGGGINFGNGDYQTNSGAQCVYLVKYNLSGTLIWSKAFDSGGDNIATGVGVDNAGHVYVTGYSQSDTVKFGSQYLLNSHPNSADYTIGYVVKFDAGGTTQWIKGSSGGGGVVCNAIAVDPSGNCYITGHVFNPGTFMGTATTNGGLFAKLTANGNLTWMQETTPAGQLIAEGTGIALDNSGNFVVSGSYAANINFGSVALSYGGSGGSSNRFVAKMSAATGACSWAKGNGMGQAADYAFDVATDLQNNVYVTGFRAESGNNGIVQKQFVEKFDPSGNSQWTNSYNMSVLSQISSITTDKQGNIYASFNINDTTVYGTYTVSPIANNFPIVMTIVKLDGTGNVLYTKSTTNPASLSWTQANSIALDEGGDIFINGCIGNECKFDNIDIHPSSPNIEYFMAKLGNNVTGGGGVVSGIKTQSMGNKLSVYPNPASGVISINGLNEKAGISITDLSGKIVLAAQASAAANTVDISPLPNGAYILEVNTAGTKAYQKIIISGH